MYPTAGELVGYLDHCLAVSLCRLHRELIQLHVYNYCVASNLLEERTPESRSTTPVLLAGARTNSFEGQQWRRPRNSKHTRIAATYNSGGRAGRLQASATRSLAQVSYI